MDTTDKKGELEKRVGDLCTKIADIMMGVENTVCVESLINLLAYLMSNMGIASERDSVIRSLRDVELMYRNIKNTQRGI